MTTFSTRDRRRKTSRHRPFAEGLIEPERPHANTPCVLAVFPVEGQPGQSVALIEDEYWYEREDPARAFHYGALRMEGETELEYHGCDTLRDAQALVRHWITPLPVEVKTHTPADETWWSINAPASPFQGTLPALTGGAPEPEAVCGVSGAWLMPGEDDEIVADLWPVAIDHDADGPRSSGAGYPAEW